jgi:ubiquinone/menaquinone biosynthesis C-methylase UbiE
MEDSTVRRCWEGNARAWTELSRAGYDVCRDHLNTPAFFELLPDVSGLSGIDIGCGEGHNTHLLSARGARMTAVDIALEFARAASGESPSGIHYLAADALRLPFRDASFDFAAAFMSLMDAGAPERVLPEAARILRPGGFLQFSILHPCFSTPHRTIVRDTSGTPVAVEVGHYFERTDQLERWTFSAALPEAREGLPLFEVPRFYRTLADWLNAIADGGLLVERCEEPSASIATAARIPGLADTRVAPLFLLFRCRRNL